MEGEVNTTFINNYFDSKMLDMLRNTVPKFGQKNRPVFEFIKEEPVVIVP